MRLHRGAMGWFVIVAFPGHTHLHFFTILKLPHIFSYMPMRKHITYYHIT